MSNLLEQFRGAAGIAFGHAIVDALGSQALPTNPANYEIWTAYKSGSHSALVRDIDVQPPNCSLNVSAWGAQT